MDFLGIIWVFCLFLCLSVDGIHHYTSGPLFTKIYRLIGIWIPIINLRRTYGDSYTRKMASLLVYRGPISYHIRIWSRHIFDFSQLKLPNTEQIIYTGKYWLRRHIWCSFVQRHFNFCISINKTTIHVTYVRCHQTVLCAMQPNLEVTKRLLNPFWAEFFRGIIKHIWVCSHVSTLRWHSWSFLLKK